MLKALCGGCGYTIRLTRQWADVGMPTCQCGTRFTLEQKPGEDEPEDEPEGGGGE